MDENPPLQGEGAWCSWAWRFPKRGKLGHLPLVGKKVKLLSNSLPRVLRSIHRGVALVVSPVTYDFTVSPFPPLPSHSLPSPHPLDSRNPAIDEMNARGSSNIVPTFGKSPGWGGFHPPLIRSKSSHHPDVINCHPPSGRPAQTTYDRNENIRGETSIPLTPSPHTHPFLLLSLSNLRQAYPKDVSHRYAFFFLSRALGCGAG